MGVKFLERSLENGIADAGVAFFKHTGDQLAPPAFVIVGPAGFHCYAWGHCFPRGAKGSAQGILIKDQPMLQGNLTIVIRDAARNVNQRFSSVEEDGVDHLWRSFDITAKRVQDAKFLLS